MIATDVSLAVYEKLLEKSVKKIKSNDPMPTRSKANVEAFMEEIRSWRSKHRERALRFADSIGHAGLFELMHSIRRWYSGQTMARKILSYRDDLRDAMDLEPEDVVGIYRGFKVDRDDPIASREEGDTFALDIIRNNGFSSWSTGQKETNQFSGSSKEKVGIIVKLEPTPSCQPVLAPQAYSEAWFNALYERVIGKSYRPTENEYLIYGKKINVKIVKIKR